MKNSVKRNILGVFVWVLVCTFLEILSAKTNLFHCSITSYGMGFFIGSLTEIMVVELGWGEDD